MASGLSSLTSVNRMQDNSVTTQLQIWAISYAQWRISQKEAPRTLYKNGLDSHFQGKLSPNQETLSAPGARGTDIFSVVFQSCYGTVTDNASCCSSCWMGVPVAVILSLPHIYLTCVFERGCQITCHLAHRIKNWETVLKEPWPYLNLVQKTWSPGFEPIPWFWMGYLEVLE